MSRYYQRRKLYVIIVAAIIAILAGMTVMLTAQTGNGKPDYNVQVVDFYPQGIVNTPTNITIKFSNNLVPDDSLNKLTADIPFIINPPVKGLGRWINNNEFRYFPDAMYAPSTMYQVIVKSDQSYIDGNRIREGRVFEFRTPTFVVEDVRTEVVNVPDKVYILPASVGKRMLNLPHPVLDFHCLTVNAKLALEGVCVVPGLVAMHHLVEDPDEARRFIEAVGCNDATTVIERFNRKCCLGARRDVDRQGDHVQIAKMIASLLEDIELR